MKVILYNPQSTASRKRILPLSLLALGALLEGRHDYVIVDVNLEPDPLEALNRRGRGRGAPVLGKRLVPDPHVGHAVPLVRSLLLRHPLPLQQFRRGVPPPAA